MNREALEQTIRVLKDVQQYNLGFDLATFVGYYVDDGDGILYNNALWRLADYEGVKKFQEAMEKEQFILLPHNCGCTACATGYAGLDPWFRDQGFRTTADGSMELVDPITENVKVLGWDSLSVFYQINNKQAEYLFTQEAYDAKVVTDPQEVINRIEEVLADGFPPETDE